jgi:hypothetical protein
MSTSTSYCSQAQQLCLRSSDGSLYVLGDGNSWWLGLGNIYSREPSFCKLCIQPQPLPTVPSPSWTIDRWGLGDRTMPISTDRTFVTTGTLWCPWIFLNPWEFRLWSVGRLFPQLLKIPGSFIFPENWSEIITNILRKLLTWNLNFP